MMRILQICNKSPYPPKEGGPMAMNAVTEMLLQQGNEVKILAVNTPKYTVDMDKIDKDYLAQTNLELIFIDTRFTVKGALKSLLKNTSYHVDRFISSDMKEKIKQVLQSNNFDAVIIETVYMSVYADLIRQYSNAKIILRAHNVEHDIWQKVAINKPWGLTKLYLSVLAKQLKMFECRAIQKFDDIFCISQDDVNYFQTQTNENRVKLVPFSVHLSSTEIEVNSGRERNLFSIASMDWQPNIDGLDWFLDKVWNGIYQKYPHLTFTIAGRNMPSDFQSRSDCGIDVVGEVPDAKQFMLEQGILIVPLWAGSGIRIKIIEAMSLGKVVISTTIGKQGIDAEHKKHILIADTPQEFVDAVTFCLENPQSCREIAFNAATLIHQNYNLTKNAGILQRYMEE